MQHHVEAEPLEDSDSAQHADDDLTIDFIPEPHQLVRPRRAATSSVPRWVIVAGVVVGTALVFAALAMKPTPAVKQAAMPQVQIVRVNGKPATSGKIEVFELPPWNDDEPGAKMVNVPQD